MVKEIEVKEIEVACKILGFQDCVVEILRLREKGVQIESVKLSDLVENYKKQLAATN